MHGPRHTFAELTRSIGDNVFCARDSCPKGVGVPIFWAIRDPATGNVLASGQDEGRDPCGWADEYASRNIARIKNVPEGRYLFVARVTAPVPDLANYKVRMVMELDPKSESSWKAGVVLWGSFATYLIAIPLAVCAAIYLIFAGIRFWLKESALRRRGTL